MNPIDLITAQLEANLGLILMHLGDLSDADLLVRPVPGANHAAYQLGHLALSEQFFMAPVRPGAIKLPEGWDKKFNKNTCGCDDPSQFPGKEELIKVLSDTRRQTIEAVKTVSPDELPKETGIAFIPTIAKALLTLGEHSMMHVGQIQVIRRKIGKPILF